MSQGASEWPVDVNGPVSFLVKFFFLCSRVRTCLRACVRDSVPW